MVIFIRKDESYLMRFLGVILWPFNRRFMTMYWTTMRLPFRKARIYHPTSVLNPLSCIYSPVVKHERVHVEQMRTAWGLLRSALLYTVFPLPVLFSGRWWIEREAYLVNIKDGDTTIDKVVDTLWRDYGWCWPRGWMRKWFKQQTGENNVSKKEDI